MVTAHTPCFLALSPLAALEPEEACPCSPRLGESLAAHGPSASWRGDRGRATGREEVPLGSGACPPNVRALWRQTEEGKREKAEGLTQELKGKLG